MGKLRRNETGFGIVEALLILIIVGLVGIVGWLAYRSHHETTITDTNPSCGTLSLSAENGAQLFLKQADYNKLKSCFLGAYKGHRSASVTLHLMGVDTGSTDTYTTDGAVINDKSVSYSANFGGSQSTHTSSCSSMKERLGGIVLTCNGYDVLYSPDG